MNVVALLPYLVEHYDDPSTLCIDAAIAIADVSLTHYNIMSSVTRILGILWYEFVTNVEVATLSHLPSINDDVQA